MFLHYPVNFLLLPKLFHYGNIIFSVIIEGFIAGMTVAMVCQAKRGIGPRIRTNCRKAFRRYLPLVAVWILLLGLMTLVFKGPSFLITKYYTVHAGIFRQGNFMLMAFGASLLVAIMIQAIFAYAIPAVMIEQKKTFKALERSIAILKGLSFKTFLLVLIPTILTFVMMVLKFKLPALMKAFFPEITLYVMVLNIILIAFSNYLLFSSVTILFCSKCSNKKDCESDKGLSK
ncbi:MAG: hypothetical protein ABH868_02900 [bacterium]